MKKFLVLSSIVFLIALAGCSTENNEMINNDILTETTEHTTLSAPVNQEGDLTEKQDIKEIRNISDTIKISCFNKEISTNRFDEGDEYNILESTKNLPNGIVPIGFPNDILSSNSSYKKIDDNHYWYNFRYANSKEKRYVFFQATDFSDFKNVDDAFIMTLEESTINNETVYIASYPNTDFDAECYLAYYGRFGYRCLLESVNLTQDEFIKILSSTIVENNNLMDSPN